VLKQAFAANPRSEAIWLAAAKLEWENEEMERARALLARARAAAPSARVALKSALLEREAGDAGAEEALLREGVAAYPTAPKLWMMLGQLYERVGGAALLERAREAYTTGLRACPHSVPLWLLAARLEERAPGGGVAKARTVLEAARLRNPRSPPLFLEAVRLERRAGQARLAENLLARALQECPASGVLWAEDILTAPRPAQKRKSVEAVRRCDNDAHVVLAVGLLFWGDRKHEKARKWLHRACALDPDLGDAWVRWYAFETQHGTAESRADVERRFLAAEPAHGERWQAVTKSAEARRLGRLEVLRLAVQRLRAEEAASGLWDQKPAGLGFAAGGAPDADDGEGAGAGAGAAAGAAASSSSTASAAAPAAPSAAGPSSGPGAAGAHGESTWGAAASASAGVGAASRGEPPAAPVAVPGDASWVHSDASVAGDGERMDERRGGPP
jgi:pre-mRNA-processing factor 6